jgi:hypothetical protein
VGKKYCHWKTVDRLKAENSIVILFSPFNCCMFMALFSEAEFD